MSQTISKSPSVPSLSDLLGLPCSLEEALYRIKSDPETYQKFLSFPPVEQEKVLLFIAGQKGIKILYDSFFQKVMSPHLHPERLESFISELIDKMRNNIE